MALTAGTRFGSYEILSLIGKGGMGEVYRARDTKLGREVAIKALPEEFAQDRERLARFRREAQVIAALNHPNIAAIYELEEFEGKPCLVLELVEGESVAARLKRGPLPVDEALQVAKQIADALEAAHDKGIVHRDLKPANIKIAPEGKVKVLDFGLAKVVKPGPVDLTRSGSVSSMATEQGVFLGTVAYMSPEQARGRRVDKRTDIWAFGCVLYEMLTGRPAFWGEDVPEILSNILQREPNWTLLPPGVPPGIQKLLRLCLEKDMKKRRRDAGDVWIDIEQALTEPPQKRDTDSGVQAVAPVAATPLRLMRWWLVGALGVAVLALLFDRPLVELA